MSRLWIQSFWRQYCTVGLILFRHLLNNPFSVTTIIVVSFPKVSCNCFRKYIVDPKNIRIFFRRVPCVSFEKIWTYVFDLDQTRSIGLSFHWNLGKQSHKWLSFAFSLCRILFTNTLKSEHLFNAWKTLSSVLVSSCNTIFP